MPFTYTNKKGKVYYIVRMTNKRGNYQYYLSPNVPGEKEGKVALDDVPDGFELVENEKGRVSLRKKVVKQLYERHMEMVKDELKRNKSLMDRALLEADEHSITIRVKLFDRGFVEALIEEMVFGSGFFRDEEKLIDIMKEHIAEDETYHPMANFEVIDAEQDKFEMSIYAMEEEGEYWEYADQGNLKRMLGQWMPAFNIQAQKVPGSEALLEEALSFPEDGPEFGDILDVAPARPESRKSLKGVEAQLYSLKVELEYAPILYDYVGDPEVYRTIQIRGDQTLAELHEAIFEAFDRYDEHMYEFFFGRRPYDKKNKTYGIKMESPLLGLLDTEDQMAGTVYDTTTDDLELKKGSVFRYLFDYGDDWLHKIKVLEIDKTREDDFPKIIEKKGKSPPQYPDYYEDG